jgi:mannose-6-phosphate isomerase-like protein (cupin superfamily)
MIPALKPFPLHRKDTPMKPALALLFAIMLAAPTVSAQAQAPDYGMLDGSSYNPKVHPDIDLFIGNWRDSMPRQTFGSLIERDILTKSAGDPLHPAAKGAVLTFINRLTYGLLDNGYSTTPSKLTGEQIIFYIDKGEGTFTAGGKTVALKSGITVLLPPAIEFVMKNTGAEPLTMYLIAEPVPAGFVPKTEIVVRDENTLPIDGADIHWSHIPKFFLGKKDGLATIDGMAPVWFDGMTMGQPHSHNPGFEEIWFSVEGDPTIFLGKQLRPFPPGTAYKIPPDYMTPHSTINVSMQPVKTFWFLVRTVPEPPPPSYSMLYDLPFDPKTTPDIDLFISSWKESMPRCSHGSLIERDIFTKGDPLHPPTRGAVLKYVNRFVYASLYAHNVTTPVTLSGEQEIYYIISGKGTMTAGKQTADLYAGIAVLMPANLSFTMKNTGDEPLTMYLISEPIPAGFRPNKDMLVVDENKTPVSMTDAHWVGIVKPLFVTKDGLGTMESILTCQWSPNTIFHPHSHIPGCEEVWTSLYNPSYFLLGKQIRLQEPGTAFLIPTDSKTPHATFNLTDKPFKLFYFARYQDHEVRK